jgi:putative inorganic carbon (HCO3(-)) transporter
VLFRRRHAAPVVAALAVQIWLHTAFAVAQAATGRPIGTGVFGGRATVMTEALSSGLDLLRPSGLFVHPIVYADFLFLTLPVAAAGALAARRVAARAALWATVAFGACGLVLTLSRGAWLASLVTGAVFVALGLRRRLLDPSHLRVLAKLAVAGGLVVAVAFGPRIYDRLTESHTGNLDVRFELNWIALRMIADRPLLGQGLNTFTETMSRFDPKDVMAYFPAPAHNLYLLEAAEAGLPALALLVALFVSIFAIGVRGSARIADPALAWLAIAVTSGIAGLLVSQLADFSLRLEPLRTTAWFLIGILFGSLHAGGAGAPAGDRSLVAPAAHGLPLRARLEEIA